MLEAEDKEPMEDTKRKQKGDALTNCKAISSVFYKPTCWTYPICR